MNAVKAESTLVLARGADTTQVGLLQIRILVAATKSKKRLDRGW